MRKVRAPKVTNQDFVNQKDSRRKVRALLMPSVKTDDREVELWYRNDTPHYCGAGTSILAGARFKTA